MLFRSFAKAIKQTKDNEAAQGSQSRVNTKAIANDAKLALSEQNPRGGRLILYVTFFALTSLIIWSATTYVEELTRAKAKSSPRALFTWCKVSTAGFWPNSTFPKATKLPLAKPC